MQLGFSYVLFPYREGAGWKVRLQGCVDQRSTVRLYNTPLRPSREESHISTAFLRIHKRLLSLRQYHLQHSIAVFSSQVGNALKLNTQA